MMDQLAQRYAKAAWAAAASADARQQLVDDFAAFCAALTDAPKLRQTLVHPAFKDARAKVLADVLASAGTRQVAARLVQLLVEHERVPLLSQVNLALHGLADEAAGRLRADVRVAVQPSADQCARLQATLQRRMGKPVVVDWHVEPKLVAGMICRVGKLTFDSSLRKQLAQFAERAQTPSA